MKGFIITVIVMVTVMAGFTNSYGTAVVNAGESTLAKPDEIKDSISARKPGETISVIFDDLASRFMTYPYKELLVVWIIDDSPSLEDDREAIENKISNLLDSKMLRDKKMLNMAVVGFGKMPNLHCSISRDDKQIKKAIMEVGTKGSGIENPMAAIEYSIRMFKQSTIKKIFIVVTDEKGEDNSRVETTLEQLKKNNITVYVIGGEASFAQRFGEDQDRHLIESGMESLYPEVLDGFLNIPGKLTYNIKSGFGPYALSRLYAQTGGNYYFLKGRSYPENVMKSYEPDLCSAEEYKALNKENTLRRIITDILREVNNPINGWEWLRLTRSYFYSPIEVETAIRDASNALNKINDLTKNKGSALASALVNIKTEASDSNKRWIANGELVLAQLYRVRYKLNRYIITLKEFIKSPDAFKPPLVKETATHYAESYYVDDDGSYGKEDDYKSEARNALQKVVEHHPNTPWSTAAQQLKEEYLDGFAVKRVHHEKPEPPKKR